MCKLNLLSANFAKSLFRSSSAVSLEKLSSPKGFQPGWELGAARVAWPSPLPGWYTLCWDEQGEPEGVVLADLQCKQVETRVRVSAAWFGDCDYSGRYSSMNLYYMNGIIMYFISRIRMHWDCFEMRLIFVNIYFIFANNLISLPDLFRQIRSFH